MRRLLPHMVLLSTALACGPAVKNAGHTVSPVPTKHDASGRRPTTAPSTEESPSVPPAPSERPATEPARAPLYAQVPEEGTLIGTAGPVALEGMGRGGHWVSSCSLPSGTSVDARGVPEVTPQLHLHLGASDEKIDALLRADEEGRYLVALISGAAWLIDAVGGKRLDLTELSPDLRADSLADHRSFAFTSDGLVILRSGANGGAPQGYYLSLSDEKTWTEPFAASARTIDWGKRPVWRVESGTRSFFATTLPENSTEMSWPVPPSDAPVLRCAAPATAYHAFERLSSYRPDQSLEVTWASVPKKGSSDKVINTEHAPGFVAPFGEGWVRREDSGRLLLVSGKTQQQIASENCGARVLRADVASGLFLVACEEYTPVVPKASTARKSAPKYRFDLYLIRPGFVRGLKADLMRTGVDFFGPEERSLTPLRPGSDAALVDFGTRKMITLGGDLHVLATDDKQALLRKKKGLALWTNKGEIPIDHPPAPLAPVINHGPAVAIGDTMFLLGGELRTWQLPAAPLETTSQGYAVIPRKAPAPSLWPEGPLLLVGPPSSDAESADASVPANK